MTARYLFNTSGNYVAFISGANVFTPKGVWMGVVTHGNQFYDTHGVFKGYVLSDDRVAYNLRELSKPRIARPVRPVRPILPVRPMRRLRMTPVPAPYKDLFADAHVLSSAPDRRGAPPNFDQFLNAKLYAADGTFLGTISTNRFDPDSLSNPFGTYGSKYNSASIFNKYGEYGSPYGAQSPFNRFAQPVKIVKDNQVVGEITRNRLYKNGIDPDKFMSWFSGL